jgi:hypothetical protein
MVPHLLTETTPMPKTKRRAKKTTATRTTAAAAPKKITKTAFVLSQGDIPANDVVEKAKAAGITITKGHVHTIRTKANAKGKMKRGRGRPAGKRGPGRPKIAAARKSTATIANKKVSKASFIMSFSLDTPAKEIVGAGKAKGMKFTGNYVARIRSYRATDTGRGPGRPGGARTQTRNGAIGGDFERTLMGVVMALGLSKTRELVDRMEERLEAVLR